MDLRNAFMADRFDRTEVFSADEYASRISRVRNVMAEKKVDFALFLDPSEETYAQWLTGVRFLEYILVPAEGPVTGVLWDELNERSAAPTETPDYEKYLMQKPVFPVCDKLLFIGRWADEKIAGRIAASAPKRIGLIAPKRMTFALQESLKKELPYVEYTDLTIDMAVEKAVKSEEELAAIRISRDTQKTVYDALPALIRIGRTAEEVTDEMRYMLLEMGQSGVMSCQLFNNGKGDLNFSERHGLSNRRIEQGDSLFVLMEANGPGQQHIAFGRHISMGNPSVHMMQMIQDEVEVHRYAVSQMKADGQTTLAQIAVKTRKYANRKGYDLYEHIGWNWMHSMGSFMYEQYSLEDYTENVPLRPGIILHCHPIIYRTIQTENGQQQTEAMLLNTYRVTENGTEDLTGIPFAPMIIRQVE